MVLTCGWDRCRLESPNTSRAASPLRPPTYPRVGRSDAYSTEFDLEAEEYVPLPKGDVHKKKEIVQDVTLHDLDASNAKVRGDP